MPHRRGDRAEGGVIAEVLLVAGALVAAGIVFLVSTNLNDQGAPSAIGLTNDDAQGTTRTFTISTTSALVPWNDLRLTIDGNALAYDSTLAGAYTYCVAQASATCTSTATFDNTDLLEAGDVIYVHHTSLDAKTFQVHSRSANSVLYSKLMGVG